MILTDTLVLPPLQRRTALAALPLWLSACTTPGAAPATSRQQPRSFTLAGRATPLRSWLYLPRALGDGTRPWPLVMFLHGSGERGTELARVTVHGLPRLAAAGADFPFILCSPQLEEDRAWDPGELHALLGALRRELPVDGNRVTCTGLSLGGAGCWAWAAAHPADLAAIAPVCGYGDPAAVCRARQVPVRAYHGDADTVVPLASERACVDALRACGGQAELIVYPGVGHDAWTPAYQDPALLPWLMAQVAQVRP